MYICYNLQHFQMGLTVVAGILTKAVDTVQRVHVPRPQPPTSSAVIRCIVVPPLT